MPNPSRASGVFSLGKWTLRVVYEDDSFLVLDKPAGLSMHGGAHVSISVMRIMQMGTKRYYPVHRLDKPTSGLFMMAKRPEVASYLSRQMDKIQKTYLAIVKGHFLKKRFTINMPLHEGRADTQLKEAITYVEVLEKVSKYSLVKLRLGTGRQHQLRLHLSRLSHPICGDRRYGDAALNAKIRTYSHGKEYLYLHCYLLKLPVSKKHPRASSTFWAKPPEIFKDFLKAHGLDDKRLLGHVKELKNVHMSS